MTHPKTEPREGPCPKVGLILESGGPDPRRSGPDEQVISHLVRQLRPDVQVVVRALGGKHNLLPECGAVARLLLTVEGCVCVFVIWDLFPAWREGVSPCLREDRKAALESLRAAGVSTAKAHLVCITEELEAWLLADPAAVGAFLAERKAPHPLSSRIGPWRKPDMVANPKAKLAKLFATELGRAHRYTDYHDAIAIIRRARVDKLSHSTSFARFRDRLARVGRSL